MNKPYSRAMALAIGLAFSTGALAQALSKADYQAGKDSISAEYKTQKAACSSLSANAYDICIAEAKGKEKVANAAIESSYKPTRKNHYEERVAKAEADYSVAKTRCNDLAGNPKDVCVKEAKAAQTIAKADAKSQMKSSNANDAADEKSAEARDEARTKSADARKDARVETMEAEYGVAKEKCATYAGGAKDYCLDQAKARFGKL